MVLLYASFMVCENTEQLLHDVWGKEQHTLYFFVFRKLAVKTA